MVLIFHRKMICIVFFIIIGTVQLIMQNMIQIAGHIVRAVWNARPHLILKLQPIHITAFPMISCNDQIWTTRFDRAQCILRTIRNLRIFLHMIIRNIGPIRIHNVYYFEKIGPRIVV